MSSPQENYTYDQLVNYYGVSKVALINHKEKYPSLDVSLWQSEQDVLLELNKYSIQFGERVLAINAYLDDDEKEGIEIGTYVHHTKRKKREKLLDRMNREKSLFATDLTQLVSMHEIHLRGLYLELSRMSAKFTADRLQERRRREQWVDTQKDYLMQYYYRVCRKCTFLIDTTLVFAGEISNLPSRTGIYFLFVDGEISYIGHSSNIQTRIKNHKLVHKSYRDSGPFEIECVYARMTITQARKLEKDLIYVFNPEFNIQSKG